jgi:hypothetical protein
MVFKVPEEALPHNTSWLHEIFKIFAASVVAESCDGQGKVFDARSVQRYCESLHFSKLGPRTENSETQIRI